MDFALLVEAGGDLLDHKVGHGRVDFAGQLDEAGAEVELLGLPREIERIDGDAMAAQAGAGIKGLKAEGLGLGRVDDLVDVDAHAHAELLELVDQRDVDAAVDVFQQLGHLGDRGAADRHDAAEDGAVHCRSQLGGRRAAAADHLGNVVAGDGVVAGIFALGRKGHVHAGLVERARDLQAARVAGFQQRHDNLLGGAGIGGAFQHDELALVKPGSDRLDRPGHVAQVGLVVLVRAGWGRR